PPTYAAYETFSEGMTKYIAGDNADALPLFLHAYETDTSFTVGLLYASIAATNLRQWARADSMLRTVNLRRQELSEYNRAWLDFRLAFVHGDHEAALAAIRIAAKLAPESKAAYNRAGTAYDGGYYHEALAAIEALPSDRGPMRGYAPYSDVYTSVLHVLGLYDREYSVGVAAQKAYSHRLLKFSPIVRGLIGAGRLDSLAVVVRAAQGIRTDPVGWDYGHFLGEVAEELGAHGFPDSATVYYEQMASWLKDNDRGAATRWRLVKTLYTLGNFREARALLLPLRTHDRANPEYLGMTGLLAIKAGHLNAAKQIADTLLRFKEPYDFGTREMALARMAAALGDRDLAIARIREAFGSGFNHNLLVHRDPDFAPLRDYPPFIQLIRSKD
ncbi:MAG TPA: hypothetical protein VNC11_00025, partial [Gemmatimonadaceae bacterium]|nr:hypothetical protein [Gemmatimonadaceae bacterium]